MNVQQEFLKKMISKMVDGRIIRGVSINIHYQGDAYDLAVGNLINNQPYFIASSTKLMTIALILQLVHEGKIQLEDKILNFIDIIEYPLTLIHKGKNYVEDITIKHCLKHSSGIPDYFLLKEKNALSVFEQLQQSQDRYWTAQEKFACSSQLKSPFAPNFSKSHYSDTNFTILGLILEKIYKQPYENIVQTKIVEPLGLKQTYIYTDPTDQKPLPVFYKKDVMNIPLAMTSFGANGGAVSISSELNSFLYAFWNDYFFPKEMIINDEKFNSLFYPIKMGLGIQSFQLPSIFTMFKKVPALLGHAGINGTMAFAMPQEGFYFSGTINNAAIPNKIFQLAIKSYLTIKK